MRRLLFNTLVKTMALVAVLCGKPQNGQAQLDEKLDLLPTEMEVGPFKAGHVQGVAVDKEKGYIYLSFTTKLVKTDLEGKVIGSVDGLLGHLGCLEFYPKDGRLYGSLEYKNDAIGKGILKSANKQGLTLANAFYVAIFDVDKIVRPDMDAEKDGVMTTVFLQRPLKDYEAVVNLYGKKVKHRLGCSGIDGLSFGPEFGHTGGRHLLTVAYGVYGDKNRTDNNYQVLHQYNIKSWEKYELPLSQERMHTQGPKGPDGEYFVLTGNTNYGVQNLEYDGARHVWLMAVYPGEKGIFPNFPLYAVNGVAKPEKKQLPGIPYLGKSKTVPLVLCGTLHVPTGVWGWKQQIGDTGLEWLCTDYYLVAHSFQTKQGYGAKLKMYRFFPRKEIPFIAVDELE